MPCLPNLPTVIPPAFVCVLMYVCIWVVGRADGLGAGCDSPPSDCSAAEPAGTVFCVPGCACSAALFPHSLAVYQLEGEIPAEPPFHFLEAFLLAAKHTKSPGFECEELELSSRST